MNTFTYTHNGKPVPGVTVTSYVPEPPAASWAELYTYVPAGDPIKDNLWMERFTNRIRSATPDGKDCDCQRSWRRYLAAHQVRWDDFDAWRLDAHNDVNARIGRPLLTMD